jgi:hypothetical protein
MGSGQEEEYFIILDAFSGSTVFWSVIMLSGSTRLSP